MRENSDNEGVIKVHNIRFRKFINSGQNAVSHLIFDQRDLKTIRVKKELYVECAPHICHINCKDSGGN